MNQLAGVRSDLGTPSSGRRPGFHLAPGSWLLAPAWLILAVPLAAADPQPAPVSGGRPVIEVPGLPTTPPRFDWTRPRPGPVPAVPDVAPYGIPYARPGIPAGFQYVRFLGPAGMRIELLNPPPAGAAPTTLTAPATIGLQWGAVYRARLSAIPGHPGLTLYPTLQVVGSLHPPQAADPAQFPIPVLLREADIRAILAGEMITDVVYLEAPEHVLPVAYPKTDMPVYDLSPAENPLRYASALGRPMLVFEVGGRQPVAGALDDLMASITPSPVDLVSAGRQQQIDRNLRFGCGRCGTGGGAAVPGSHGLPVLLLAPWMPRDEYICDGGDPGNGVRSLDRGRGDDVAPTTTIAAYTGPDGKAHLTKSNRVCLYAPRFAAARVPLAFDVNREVGGPHQVHTVDIEQQLAGRAEETPIEQPVAAEAFRHRERASEYQSSRWVGRAKQLETPEEFYQIAKLMVYVGATQSSQLSQADSARLAQAVQAAITWSRPEFPRTARIAQGPGSINGRNRAHDVTQYPQRLYAGPRLQLWKLASRQTAQAGDLIEFMIKYKNLGEQPMTNVTIIDSLTARLEYVAGSQRSDRAAFFPDPVENDVGSVELRWILRAPLQPGESGVVRFQTRVR